MDEDEAIVWYPPELPPPTRADFSRQLGDGRRFAQNAAGPPSVRPGARQADIVAMATILTLAESKRWERWRSEELNGALDPFWMRAWGEDGAPLASSSGAVLLSSTGAPLLHRAIWLCMLDKRTVEIRPYRNSNRWLHSFAVAVMP